MHISSFLKDDNVWINTCCWVGNLQSVNSQIKENPDLIHRSGIYLNFVAGLRSNKQLSELFSNF